MLRPVPRALAVILGTLVCLNTQTTPASAHEGHQGSGPSASHLPQGVVIYQNDVIIDISKLSNGVLNITKSMLNAGTLLLVSSNPNMTSAVIDAKNILNLMGAKITTVLPAGGVPGYSNLDSTVNLTLDVTHLLANAGSINSSGTLTLNAPQVLNMSSFWFGNSGGAINATSGITIKTNNMMNAGLISTQSGNINISNNGATNSLHILNLGGTIQANAGTISASSSNNLSINGGKLSALTIAATAGQNLNLRGTALDAVTDQNGNGGTITLVAGTSGTGTLSMFGSTLNANGTGSGSGGTVDLTAPDMNFGSALASANGGSQAGNGGNIQIIASAPNGSFNVGSGQSAIEVTATGGSANTSGGGGGTVQIVSGGNLKVNGSGIDVLPLGTEGNGGTIELAAGYQSETPGNFNGATIPIYTLGSSGTLTLAQGNISADAVGNDNGGGLIVMSAPNINAGTQGNVVVSARGGANAGFIVVNAVNTLAVANHNLTFADDAVNYSSTEFAGTTDITAQNVTAAQGSLEFSGMSSNVGSFGGLVALHIDNYTGANGQPMIINVSGINGAGGGDFNITSGPGSNNVYLDNVTVIGTNTEVNAPVGDTTWVNASVAGNLTFRVLNMDVSSLGSGGTGGQIVMNAGTSGTGALTISSGSITANGTGSGNGGPITIIAPQVNIPSTVPVTSNGGTSGSAGTIDIQSTSPVSYAQNVDPNSFSGECLVDTDVDAAGGNSL